MQKKLINFLLKIIQIKMEKLSETVKREFNAHGSPRKRWRPAPCNRDASGAIILDSELKNRKIKNVTIIIDDLYDSLPKSLLIKYRESLLLDFKIDIKKTILFLKKNDFKSERICWFSSAVFWDYYCDIIFALDLCSNLY